MNNLSIQLDRPLKAVSLLPIGRAQVDRTDVGQVDHALASESVESETLENPASTHQDLEHLLTGINNDFQELKTEIATNSEQLKSSVIQLAVRIAKCVVSDELRHSSEHLTSLIGEQLDGVDSGIEVVIRINPLDLTRLDESGAEFIESATMIPDTAINVGNCQLTIGDKTIAHNFVRHLDEIEKRLMEALLYV